MTGPRIGGLFEGYGGLTMGVQSVLGGQVAWHSEIEPAACAILKHHWPDVPNLGDITAIDWANVEPVDIITGGSPCQDVSAAGRRAGMRPGTRSGLWESMREGIAVLRPRLVVWENVRGVTSAGAHSDLAAKTGLLGPADGGPHLRALGRVLGDMADLGFDAEWHGVRAADVGAPHGRFRVFVVAQPSSGGWPGVHDGASITAARTGREWLTGRGAGDATVPDTERGGRDGRAREQIRQPLGRVAATRDREDAATDTDCERLGQHPGEPPTKEARTVAGDKSAGDRGLRAATDWGPYRPAIERWERVLGWVAPTPTKQGPKGGQQLSPAFVEWLMGLPAGHVTEPAIGISRNAQLKALGNGVVPAQAAEAIRVCLARTEQERAA